MSRAESPAAQRETEPLLGSGEGRRELRNPGDGAALRSGEAGLESNGEAFDDVPQEKRQIGVISAVFLIFNRVIGTGIYATPSLILRVSGSVGMSLVLWIIGALIAAAGTAVFIELGSGLPRSGGEKNYLEFIYRKPRFLVTCIYGLFTIFIGWSAGNAIVFGEYVVHALGFPITRFNTRFIGVLALTATFVLHGTQLRLGLRIQNTLGVFMLAVLLFVAFAGLLNLAHVPGFRGGDGGKNLRWDEMWAGTKVEANGVVTGLYNVIWSFVGYSNANYALSEVRDPVRTLKRAAPLAMMAITAVYLLVNIAYFAVVPREELLGGGRVVAALFFKNLFGERTERAVSGIIALSVFGNMMAVMFTAGRVVQEMGREGVLPYSALFASNKPFGAPFMGLFEQWLVCCIIAVAPPPGDAFNFILNFSSYPLVLTNLAVSAGLLFLHTSSRLAKKWDWAPPFRSWTSVTAFFCLSNVFLAVVPLVPPAEGQGIYDYLPYWLHVAVCFGIGAIGCAYWYIWCVYSPRKGGYLLSRDFVLQEDGVSRNVFVKTPIDVSHE